MSVEDWRRFAEVGFRMGLGNAKTDAERQEFARGWVDCEWDALTASELPWGE